VFRVVSLFGTLVASAAAIGCGTGSYAVVYLGGSSISKATVEHWSRIERTRGSDIGIGAHASGFSRS
jgi:hypothetical protein